MSPARFITDSSLDYLARRLRFLGFDVRTLEGARLEEVFSAARRDGRTVLKLSARHPRRFADVPAFGACVRPRAGRGDQERASAPPLPRLRQVVLAWQPRRASEGLVGAGARQGGDDSHPRSRPRAAGGVSRPWSKGSSAMRRAGGPAAPATRRAPDRRAPA